MVIECIWCDQYDERCSGIDQPFPIILISSNTCWTYCDMLKLYRKIELLFERLTNLVTTLLGNSIVFIIAFIIIICWLNSPSFYAQTLRECIRDILHGLIFLSLFVIQKSFNKFSAALHLKVNELLASHEPARNTVINTENKTESEIAELSKEYNDLSEEVKEIKEDVKFKDTNSPDQ